MRAHGAAPGAGYTGAAGSSRDTLAGQQSIADSTPPRDRSERTVTLLDRHHPRALERLRAMLGAEPADRLLGVGPQRYIMVATQDTGGSPRNFHLMQLVADLPELTRQLIDLLRLADSLAGLHPEPLDIQCVLTPDDRAQIDLAIDAHEAERLRRAWTRGRA